MIRKSFKEPQIRAGISKYPGRRVYNKDSRSYMHIIGEYRNFGRIVGVYSDAFDEFVNELATRIQHDLQNVVIIYGPTGSGKSSLALNLCVALAKRIGTGFDLDKDYIYTAQDLFDKLQDPNANKISLFDEGSVTLSSMLATRKSDRDIVTLFNTMRSRHFTTFICNPTFEKVNKAVREDHCDYRVRCNPPNRPLIRGYSRGFFQVRRASRRDFQQETYWPLVYTGVFGDYPPELKEKYLSIKHFHQDELLQTIHMVAKTETAKTRREAEKYLAPDELEIAQRKPVLDDAEPQETYLNPPYYPKQEAYAESPYTEAKPIKVPKPRTNIERGEQQINREMNEMRKELDRLRREAEKRDRTEAKQAEQRAKDDDRIKKMINQALEAKEKENNKMNREIQSLKKRLDKADKDLRREREKSDVKVRQQSKQRYGQTLTVQERRALIDAGMIQESAWDKALAKQNAKNTDNKEESQ